MPTGAGLKQTSLKPDPKKPKRGTMPGGKEVDYKPGDKRERTRTESSEVNISRSNEFDVLSKKLDSLVEKSQEPPIDIEKVIDQTVDKVKREMKETFRSLFEEWSGRLESRMLETETRNDVLEKEVKSLREEMESLKAEVTTAKQVAEAATIQANEADQYNRRTLIRINGLKALEGEVTKERVLNLLHNKLELFTTKPADIVRAHRVPPKTRTDPDKADSIIVRCADVECCYKILTARRKLKGSGVSIFEDITHKNRALLNRVKNHPEIESAWTMKGTVWAKARGSGKKGTKFKVELFDNIDDLLKD